MKQQPLVSVIVPVYNGEAYLERCVDSILGQQYEQIELILVNDGSTDNSLEICRQYARQDKRVRVIDKANSGVSDSRNQGMALAEGKYLQFADSDDWVTADATAMLVEQAERWQCEMVIAPFYRIVGSLVTENGHIRTEKLITIKEFARQLMKAPANFYYGVMWNKLYRRDIIMQHQLQCDTEIQWCEDFIFNLNYLCYVKHVYVLQQPMYHYVKRKDSLVSSELFNSNIYKIKRRVYTHYRNFFEQMDLYETNRAKINGFMLAVTADSLFRLPSGIVNKETHQIIFPDVELQRFRKERRIQQRMKREGSRPQYETGRPR